jgi:hypothetical protein
VELTPLHDGAIHDSAIHDSAIHDSAIHDSAIHDSAIHDSAVDGGVHPCASFGPSQGNARLGAILTDVRGSVRMDVP